MGVFDTYKKEKSEDILEEATGNPQKVSVEDLDELVDDPNPYVRQNISHAVAEVAEWNQQKIPESTIDKIIECLEDDKDTVYPAQPRGGQLHALATIASEDAERIIDAKPALEHIVSSEYNGNHIVAGPAALCLGAIRREGHTIGDRVIDNIIELLNHDEQQVRIFAINSLQMLEVDQYRTKLENLSESDPDSEVRSAAQEALNEVGTSTDTQVYNREETEIYSEGNQRDSTSNSGTHDRTNVVSFCPKCGADLDQYDEVNFCPGCGTELPES
jgi:HEAT repeat protein